MTAAFPSPFALDAHPAKAAPQLIEPDVRHFARIESSLAAERRSLESRLAEAQAAPGGNGQEAYERELEIARLNRRLRLLQRFGADLCIGRIVGESGTLYIGRVGLADAAGDRLLIMIAKILRQHVMNARRTMNKFGMYFTKDGRENDKYNDAYAASLLAFLALQKYLESGKRPKAPHNGKVHLGLNLRY